MRISCQRGSARVDWIQWSTLRQPTMPNGCWQEFIMLISRQFGPERLRFVVMPSGSSRPPTNRSAYRGVIAISDSGKSRKLKTAEITARKIAADIVNENLSSGDGLPSEAAMLKNYGVSRESLREALRLLEVQGLITLRRGPGGGPVVGYVDPASLGRMTTLYLQMAGATYHEFFEAWLISETFLAGKAARHPDPTRRASLMKPFLDEAAESDEKFHEELSTHIEFHSTVAQLADNRVLELVHGQLNQIARHHILEVEAFRVLRKPVVNEHAALAKSIAAGHPRKAEELMHEHVTAVVDFIHQSMGHVRDSYIEWH